MAPEVDETLDLALAAAFTSISLRDRWRDPVVDTDLVLTVEALEMKEGTSVKTMQNFQYTLVKPDDLLFLKKYKLYQGLESTGLTRSFSCPEGGV